MIAFIVLSIQYVLFLSITLSWWDKTFWYIDAGLHFIFILQTVIVFFRIYFFIFSNEKMEDLKDTTIMQIRALDNAIIITWLILIWVNVLLSFSFSDFFW